jgi:hypothetical protein
MGSLYPITAWCDPSLQAPGSGSPLPGRLTMGCTAVPTLGAPHGRRGLGRPPALKASFRSSRAPPGFDPTPALSTSPPTLLTRAPATSSTSLNFPASSRCYSGVIGGSNWVVGPRGFEPGIAGLGGTRVYITPLHNRYPSHAILNEGVQLA